MRATETASLIRVGEVMTHAALFRKESRFVPYHYREDYPDSDDANWCGQVLVTQADGGIATAFKPLHYKDPRLAGGESLTERTDAAFNR